MNPDLRPGELLKPLPGSGRSERKTRAIKAKQMQESETHDEMLARVEFWRLLRLDLYARDGGRCRACSVELNLDAGLAANAMHAHHLTHRSQGGKDVIENLIALCSTCHRRHHHGMLSVLGPWRSITFVARNSKGVITKAWESLLQ